MQPKRKAKTQLNATIAATFAHDLTFAELSPDIRGRAKLLFADTVGVLVAGGSISAARIMAETFFPFPSDGQAVDEGGRNRFGVAASYGAAASALDFDDGHMLGGGIHPSAVIVSSLLASSRDTDVSGQELLCAYVAGYEIAIRVGRLLHPQNQSATFHTSGTSTTIGAAAAAARLSDCDADTIRRAIEIASSFAPLATFQLSMVKESMGWAAGVGVASAQLANAGYKYRKVGDPIRPGPLAWGWPSPFDDPRASEDPFVNSIGTVYEILNGYIKPYACCRLIHGAADAFVDFLNNGPFGFEDVAEIQVRLPQSAMELSDARPQTVEMAQYSFPFVLGSIAIHGSADAESICDAQLHNETVLNVARMVTLEHSAELDTLFPSRYPSEIVVRSKTGAIFNDRREIALGDSTRPMSADAVHQKFVRNARRVLSEADSDSLWKMCLGIEDHCVDEICNALDRALKFSEL